MSSHEPPDSHDARAAGTLQTASEHEPTLRRGARYQIIVTGLPDGTFYWHLFCNQERVNGGLEAARRDAWLSARNAISHHVWGPVITQPGRDEKL